MAKLGFSILYKDASKLTDNTLITLLGKPQYEWHDNILRMLMSALQTNIPNAFRLHIVNQESPLIDKLRFMGIISADQSGSLQLIPKLIPTKTLEGQAESRGITPTDAICQALNVQLLPNINAEPFFDNAIQRQRAEDSNSPVFDFSAKTSAPVIAHLQDLANEAIDYAMSTRKHNYVFYKNAIIADKSTAPFLNTDYNNLVLVDSSHCDEEYLKNWAFLEPDDFVDFAVIASNTDPTKYAEAQLQVLQDYFTNGLIPKTLEVITK